MTDANVSTVALDPTVLPDFDYVRLGIEAVNARDEHLEFCAVADPIFGWNVLVTCPDDLMREIMQLVRARAGLPH